MAFAVVGFRDDITDKIAWGVYCYEKQPVSYQQFLKLAVDSMNGICESPYPPDWEHRVPQILAALYD